MNSKILVLFVLSVSTMCAEILTGELSFHNTLANPVEYDYHTLVIGEIPGAFKAASPGMKIQGFGQIPANTTQVVHSKVRLRSGVDIWGDSIVVDLRKNLQSPKFTFTLKQLGTYTIGVDSNNNLTLQLQPVKLVPKTLPSPAIPKK